MLLNREHRIVAGSRNEYLEQAIKLDPNYGLAWSALANASVAKAENGFLDATEGFERAREAGTARFGVESGPCRGTCHARLHLSRPTTGTGRPQRSKCSGLLPSIRQIRGAAPSGGKLSCTLGRWDDAERQFRAALVRDPLNPYVIWNSWINLLPRRSTSKTEAMYRKLLEVAAGLPWTRATRQDAAARASRRRRLRWCSRKPTKRIDCCTCRSCCRQPAVRPRPMRRCKAQIAHWADTGAFFVAQSYAYRGDHDLALEWLERAYEQKDVALVEIVGEPLFDGLADDPRFKAFLRKMKLPESLPQARLLAPHHRPNRPAVQSICKRALRTHFPLAAGTRGRGPWGPRAMPAPSPVAPRVRRSLTLPATWGPPSDRHADRACRREYLGQTAPPQGGPVGACLRRRRLGVSAGPRVHERHLRLAAPAPPDRAPRTP